MTFDANREFDTVNGIKLKGVKAKARRSAATQARSWLAGCVVWNDGPGGRPGNLLLASVWNDEVVGR